MVLMPASTVAPRSQISSLLANTQGGRSPATSRTFDLGRPGEHIASRIAGHEGYLMFVDRHHTQPSEVLMVEAEHLDRGPLVRIQLPFRLPCGVHGNRVPAQELPPE
jgi:hypothetical protein